MITLSRYAQRIYTLDCEDRWDLGMLFIRPQEYVESVNPEFRGHVFNLDSFKLWYSQTYNEGGKFNYPNDWAGYNVSGKALRAVFIDKRPEDFNAWDSFMVKVASLVRQHVNHDDYYLIGAADESAKNHELAHALWNTNKTYRDAQKEALASIPGEARAMFHMNISKMGYSDEVIEDELHAYLGTDMHSEVAKGVDKSVYEAAEAKARRMFSVSRIQLELSVQRVPLLVTQNIAEKIS
jgi:hypothetical protein